MNLIKRSFIREAYDLISNSKSEFSGQVYFYPLDEVNLNYILFDIIPKKGPYQHASIQFMVFMTPNYPDSAPLVTCRSTVYHPNIDVLQKDDNVCVNLLSNWNRRFGLKDLMHALIFLLYEPNFNDPITEYDGIPRGLIKEQLIKYSLRGAIFGDVEFAPNKAWCEWYGANGGDYVNIDLPNEDNGSFYSDYRSVSERNLFLPELSGQFGAEEVIDGYASPILRISQRHVEHLRITVQHLSLSTEDFIAPLSHCSRYYFIQIIDRSHRLSSFEPVVHVPEFPIFENGKFNFRQSAVIEQIRTRKYETLGEESTICSAISDSTCAFGIPVCIPDLDLNCINEGFDNTAGNSFNSYGCNINNNDNESNKELDSPLNAMIDYFSEHSSEDIWRSSNSPITFVGGCELSCSSYFDDSTSISDCDLKMFQTYCKNIKPFWWPLFRTRWPHYLAPGRFCCFRSQNEPLNITGLCRASQLLLKKELNYLSDSDNEFGSIILVDPLSLSPFSPIFNRIIPVDLSRLIDKSILKCWCSIEWISVSWSLWPFTHSPETKHLRLPGSCILTTLCWISNLFNYASRLELYHFCLGYSRNWKSDTVQDFGITCLTPASLVCGQCSLLDAWPLWLATHTTRWFCSIFLSLFTRFSSNLSHTPVTFYYAFSDVDEI